MTRRRETPARALRLALGVVGVIGVIGVLAIVLAAPAARSATGVPAVVPIPAPLRAPVGVPAQPSTGGPILLVLDALSPRVVTSDGPTELVVSGRLRNTGTLAVRDVGVRLQRGAALSAERDVAAALAGRDPAEEVRSAVTGVAGVLPPGATVPFTLGASLRGGPSSLAVADTGLYPALVVATGTPADGGPQRLDSERFLLPVLGPPPAPGGTPTPIAVPPVGRAERVGILYPFADRPRRTAAVPGAPMVLTDDELATSFAAGGRLDGLVGALARGAPVGSPAASSLCLAVDADLLETAQAMTGGYRVTVPGGTVAGAGSAAAATWLAGLRTQARGRCVLAVPYADADLLVTSQANLTDLTTYARADAARRVADLLGGTPLADTTWPAGGRLDERTLSDLATGGARSLVVDSEQLDVPTSTPERTTVRLAGPPGSAVVAVPTDPLAARALAGQAPEGREDTGNTEETGASGGSGTPIGRSPAGTSEALAVQDAIATVILRASGTRGTTAGRGTTLLAPPTRWAASSTEAGILLATVGELARRGLVSPVDLGTLAAGAGPMPTATLTAPAARPVAADGDTVVRARAIRDDQRDLLAASVLDRPGAPTPAEFLDPLTGDLLRALSASRRDDPAARAVAVGSVGAEMDAVRSAVRVVQPSGSYSLGSSDAPLLLTVENRLPVAMNVDVVLDPTPGLRAAPLPVAVVPAFGSRQFQIATQVTRSGEFSVDARARTPGGEALGPTSRLLLRSTAYGAITVWLTASAAVVLVILASVRITRRVRTSRSGRSDPSEGSRRGPGGPGTTPSGPSLELQR